MLAALLPALLPIVGRVLEKVIPDPEARQKAINDLYSQLAASDLAQMEVNKAEGAHRKMFVAGWRPAVGWICATALGWNYVGVPLTAYAFVLFNLPWQPPVIMLDEHIFELLFGMLGLGALRTFEKLRGVAK